MTSLLNGAMGRIRKLFAIILMMLTSLFGAHVSRADDAKVNSPVSPQESLEHLVVNPDLTVDLVASEPQVIDPVAIRFDEFGRMWVVEMRDYPTGKEGGNPALSRISILEDKDGDGFYEAATVFADNLNFATGVQPWKGGAFVTMAGEVAYMKDTDGDGRADLRETWFTGFSEQNTQLRANDPRLALDNHIYVANGLRGGEIVNVRQKRKEPLSISGMDFRFDPNTGECEAVSGAGQFGMTFDDYGNRFICSNRNPAMHVVLENRQLLKNPLAAVPAVVHDVARAGEQSRIYPITAAWTTSNLHAGQFTAACGVEVFRGTALPKDYRGNVFTCDPTNHLVHREKMTADGATFTSTPADHEKDFLASRDRWFSPVNLEVGPDGALYVVDMYRAVIEHPEWVPTELQKRPDQLLGNDRGRIYRVRSKTGWASYSEKACMLAQATNSQLIDCLSSDNPWQRDTAARLILERQPKHIHARLKTVALTGNSLAKIHACRLLEGIGIAKPEMLLAALNDTDDPRVIEQLIQISEPWVVDDASLRAAIASLSAHVDARVRVAAVLASMPYVATPTQPADRWEQQAMLIAAGQRGGELLAKLLSDPAGLEANVADAKQFVAEAARLAAASPDEEQHQQALAAVLASPKYQRVGLTSFFGELRRRGVDLADNMSKLDKDEYVQLQRAFEQANVDVQQGESPDEQRCESIDLLALREESAPTITALAIDDASQAIQLRAVAALMQLSAMEPWRELLKQFAPASPAVQRAVLDGLLARNDRTSLLLEKIAEGDLKPSALDAARATALLNHRDEAIRQRAETLFAEAIPADRQQVLADYQVVLGMKGDVAHGREVFAKHCATCHKIGDVGVNFAPDISDSREKSPEQLLTDVIQPNRAVDANYFSYTAVTVDGLAITGILTAETSTSITLKESFDKQATLSRSELEQLASNGVSMMPEGLEREIPQQHMADLIAFIKNWRYLDSSSPPLGK